MTALLSVELGAVLSEWAWLLDHGHYRELAGLFTPDAVLTAAGATVRGRGQIEQRYASRTGVRTSRHVGSGIRIVETSAARARTTSVWVCYAANLPAPADDVGIYLVADFHTAFAHTDDGWLISALEIVPVLRDPTRAPP